MKKNKSENITLRSLNVDKSVFHVLFCVEYVR